MGFRIHTWKLRNMHESSSLDIKLCITKYFSVGCSESTLFLPSVQLSKWCPGELYFSSSEPSTSNVCSCASWRFSGHNWFLRLVLNQFCGFEFYQPLFIYIVYTKPNYRILCPNVVSSRSKTIISVKAVSISFKRCLNQNLMSQF